MALTYRTVGAWGPGKGSNLTPIEADNNTYDHKVRIDALETSQPSPVEISTITVNGNQFTVWLDNGDSVGPFTLPVASFRSRGAWVAATAYLVNDLVSVPSLGIYYVLQNHTSAATFDEGASNSVGDFYQLVFPINVPAPWVLVATITYTPVLADANRMLRCTAGCDLVLPSYLFPDGTEIHVLQDGASAVSFSTDSDGTIKVPIGDDTVTARQGSAATCKWNETDGVWHIFGDLAEVSA